MRAELKLHPDDAEALSLLGYALDTQKKFPEGDSVHRRAVAAAPRSTRVLGRYANHLVSTGDEKGARKTFQGVIAIDPADRYANLRLAQLALKGKDAAHAKEALLYLRTGPERRSRSRRRTLCSLIAHSIAGTAVAVLRKIK